MFENLSPGQQQALKYGAPLVAAVAIGVKLAGGKKAAADPVAPTPVTVQTPTTDAVGVGQLAEFESSFSDALYGIQQSIDNLVNNPNPVTPTPVPTAATPLPAPIPAPAAPAPMPPLTPTPPGSLPPAPSYALTPYNTAPFVAPAPTGPLGVTTTPTAPRPSGRTHVVQAGETLNVIGRYYGIPWQKIAEANHLGGGTSLTLHAGQVLILPVYP